MFTLVLISGKTEATHGTINVGQLLIAGNHMSGLMKLLLIILLWMEVKRTLGKSQYL